MPGVHADDAGAIDAIQAAARGSFPEDLALAVGSVRTEQQVTEAESPAPEVRLMPTGGVAIDEIGCYLDVGTAAVGLSGPLLGDALLPGGDLAALAGLARQPVAAASSR